jgi:hypothetical protein
MRRWLEKLNLRFDRSEISGSLGDLGTFLPLAVGLVSRCGMNLGHIMFFAGAMHFVSGLTFGIPMPVQPMKSIAAIAIAEGLDEATILAAGIGAGVVLLLLALTGLIDRIGRILPRSIVRGIQLAIGLKLLIKGASLIAESGSWLAVDSIVTGMAGFILILATFKVKKFPGAMVVIAAGLGLLFLTQPAIFSRLSLGWELPTLQVITQADFITGFWRGTLPQIPLTILNSVIAVSVLSADLFPLRPLKPRKVTISVALMNLIACPLGGMPMCHGAGGLAAQYRFGARTGGSVVFLGTAKMLLAILFGSSLLVIFTEFPASLLGVLLVFSGLELAAVCRDQIKRQDFFVMILTAGVSIAVNVAVGFTAGTLVALMIYRQRMLPAEKEIVDKESSGLLRKVPSHEK